MFATYLHDEPVKIAADVASGAIVVAAWADYLPTIAAILSIIWMAIRIWETETIQRLFRRKPTHKETEE
jgi:hypothetical protein